MANFTDISQFSGIELSGHEQDEADIHRRKLDARRKQLEATNYADFGKSDLDAEIARTRVVAQSK